MYYNIIIIIIIIIIIVKGPNPDDSTYSPREDLRFGSLAHIFSLLKNLKPESRHPNTYIY